MKLTLRIWILIIALLFSLLAISPGFGKEGVVVTSIDVNSSVREQGLSVGEIITSINGQEIKDKNEYTIIAEGLFIDGFEKRVDIVTEDTEYTIFTNETLKMTVENVPKSKIKTGLDLSGGARALVQPDVEISDDDLQDLVEISRNRFNVYGLSDVNVKGVSDLSGDKFLLVEIAGATPKDLQQLVGQQGKFEAKVGNETVFVGGKDKDVRDVCRNDATCASITNCFPAQQIDGISCSKHILNT